MSTAAHPARPVQMVLSRLSYGAVAGIGGGIAFGIVMAAAGMLPMVAMLVGSENAGVGVGVHLVISAILGAGFGLVVPFTSGGSLLGAGVVYGVVWWVLGGLLLMPAGLGMPVLQLGEMAMVSLLGHVLYGVVTAVVLYAFRRRAGYA